jgi:hypothetical protein
MGREEQLQLNPICVWRGHGLLLAPPCAVMVQIPNGYYYSLAHISRCKVARQRLDKAQFNAVHSASRWWTQIANCYLHNPKASVWLPPSFLEHDIRASKSGRLLHRMVKLSRVLIVLPASRRKEGRSTVDINLTCLASIGEINTFKSKINKNWRQLQTTEQSH